MKKDSGSTIPTIDFIEKIRKNYEERGYETKANRLSALKRMLAADGVNPPLNQKQQAHLEDAIAQHVHADLQEYAKIALFLTLIQRPQ